MLRARGTHGALVIRRCKSKKISLRWTNLSGTFFRFLPIFLRGHVVMMVMVKMVKIEMEKKEKCSIIYNIYIFIYYSIKMAFPKIDFDQNDHDHFDHDTGAVQHRNLDSGEKCVTWCHFVATPHTRRESFRCACVSYCRFVVTKWHSFRVWHLCCMMWGESRKAIERK